MSRLKTILGLTAVMLALLSSISLATRWDSSIYNQLVKGILRVKGAAYLDSDVTVASGKNILRGSYSVPAARDSAESTLPLIQYGKKKVTSGQAIDFTGEGLSDYSAAPTLLSLVPVEADHGDSTYNVFAAALTESTLTVGINILYQKAGGDSVAVATTTDSLTVHYVLIGK